MKRPTGPAKEDARAPRLAGVVAGLCLVLTVILYVAARQMAGKNLKLKFRNGAEEVALSLQQTLERNLLAVEHQALLFDLVPVITHSNFQASARSLLKSYRAIQALEWIPVVSHAERAAFEEAVRQEGYPGFKLTERVGQGPLEPAVLRPQYFPVCYVEPENDNEQALGYDVGTHPTRRAALEKARDTGQMVATARLTLVRLRRSQAAFLAYQPIFRGGGIPATVEERRARLRGFVVGVYRTHDLVELALRHAHQTELLLHLFDPQAPRGEKDLYGQPPPVTDFSQHAMVERTLQVGQRDWRLSLYPSLAFLQSRRDWTPEWLLAAGLLVTLVVGNHLFHLHRRAGQVAQLVTERTAELTAANARMQRTLAACQRAEAALQQSLQEKEILLKEVHHRVKNNLQIVSSFLSLQADQVEDEASRSALRNTQDRVRAMALLHEGLYRSGDLAHANFPAYVASLCTQMSQAYGVVASRIRIVQSVAPVALDLDQAVTLGLVLSELLSNALKHAFPGERAGWITVEIRAVPPSQAILRVADDGVGLPPGFQVAQTQSLGLHLVERLARKLGGTLHLAALHGTTAWIEFPTAAPPEES